MKKSITKFIILVAVILCIGLFSTNVNADLAIPNGTPVKPSEDVKVTFMDYKGNVILETTNDYWLEHQDELERKYRLGKYSPNKMIVNYLREKGEMAKSKGMELGQISKVEADQIFLDMLNAGIIEKVPGKADVYKLTKEAINKKPIELIREK